MRIFQGCIRGDEVAMTRRGANPHTAVLVTKTLTQPAPESQDMTPAEVAKTLAAVLAMGDVTKAHYLGLTPEAQVAFIAKTPDEQKGEAEAAKAAADKIIADAAAATAGLNEREVALSATVTSQGTQIADLTKRLAEQDIEKRAREEFAGFPGGATKAAELLKTFAALPQAAREASEGLMRSQCELAKRTGAELGYNEEETAKAMPATAKLNSLAAEVAKTKSIPLAEAIGEIMVDAAHADLFAQVRAEELATRH